MGAIVSDMALCPSVPLRDFPSAHNWSLSSCLSSYLLDRLIGSGVDTSYSSDIEFQGCLVSRLANHRRSYISRTSVFNIADFNHTVTISVPADYESPLRAFSATRFACLDLKDLRNRQVQGNVKRRLKVERLHSHHLRTRYLLVEAAIGDE